MKKQKIDEVKTLLATGQPVSLTAEEQEFYIRHNFRISDIYHVGKLIDPSDEDRAIAKKLSKRDDFQVVIINVIKNEKKTN